MDIIKFHNFYREKNETKEQSISRIIMYHIDKIPNWTFAFPTNRGKIRPMIDGRGKPRHRAAQILFAASMQRQRGKSSELPFLFASVASYEAEPNSLFAAHYARS